MYTIFVLLFYTLTHILGCPKQLYSYSSDIIDITGSNELVQKVTLVTVETIVTVVTEGTVVLSALVF